MITIHELTKIIKEELDKRDLTGERSPVNKWLFKEGNERAGSKIQGINIMRNGLLFFTSFL